VSVSCDFEFKPSDADLEKSGTPLALRVKPTPTMRYWRNMDPVIIRDITRAKKDFAGARLAIVRLFAEWLKDNFDTFGHIFASIVTNPVTIVEKLQWLQPANLEYVLNSTKEMDPLAKVFFLKFA